MLTASLEPQTSLYREHLSYLPDPLTFSNYTALFRADPIAGTNFPRYFENSLIVVICTVILSLLIAVPAAYGFSRYRFFGKNVILYGILLQSLLPLVNFLIPLYLFMQKLGLLDTYAALVIGYLTFSLPLNIWILKGFFDGIPADMETFGAARRRDRLPGLRRDRRAAGAAGDRRDRDLHLHPRLGRVSLCAHDDLDGRHAHIAARHLLLFLRGGAELERADGDGDRHEHSGHRRLPHPAALFHRRPDQGCVEILSARDARRGASTMARVNLTDVCKTYTLRGREVRAVLPLEISIGDGEFVTILGPSGCGKTTLLSMIVGAVTPSGGRILVDGADVTYADPRERDMAMVFQNYALYPSKTVRGNLEFPLRMRGIAADDRARRVKEMAELLGLQELLDSYPRQLSGGQQQRVALGRALIRRPKLFLMDEPLSNLDAKLRLQMRTEIKRLHRELPVTTVYVTHDQSEAMLLSDRVVVMNGGAVAQVDTPEGIYHRPADLFVAGFVGAPAMNLLPVTFSASGGQVHCIDENRRRGAHPARGRSCRHRRRAFSASARNTSRGGPSPASRSKAGCPAPCRRSTTPATMR